MSVLVTSVHMHITQQVLIHTCGRKKRSMEGMKVGEGGSGEGNM